MTTDIVIIGGGPAGLQAALSIGRVHRQAVLLDDGTYRNARVTHMHNVIGQDGTPPATLRAAARAELAAYPTVEVRDVRATTVTPRPDGTYAVTLAAGEDLVARAVILATGVRDELPQVDGLQDLWGGRAAQCPFCHAHEFAGGRFGILGTGPAAHLTALLEPVAGSLVLLPLEGDPAGAPVRAVRDTGDGVDVTLADGSTEHVDVLFLRPELHQGAPFAAQLGLARNDSGAIRVDEFQRTSLPGVMAAGDLAHVPALPMPMQSVVMAMAAGQVAASAAVMSLIGPRP